jgi:hypothetical protein
MNSITVSSCLLERWPRGETLLHLEGKTHLGQDGDFLLTLASG